jgi:hypothetical protein
VARLSVKRPPSKLNQLSIGNIATQNLLAIRPRINPTGDATPNVLKALFLFGPGGKYDEHNPIAVGVLAADPTPKSAISAMKTVELGVKAVTRLLVCCS